MRVVEAETLGGEERRVNIGAVCRLKEGNAFLMTIVALLICQGAANGTGCEQRDGSVRDLLVP